MTLAEMKDCAAETLAFFMEAMPEAPFTAEGIVIEFAKPADMATRAKALCEKYVPDRTINESQARELNTAIAANALTGRDKSAVIACINHRLNRQQWRHIFFHEFMHIFCAKSEVDGEHFMDVFGNIYTPDPDPENKIYDGNLNAGYAVWSEFIAEYYTIQKTNGAAYKFPDVMEYSYGLLGEVSVKTGDLSKDSLAMACACLLNCADADEILHPDPADENPHPAPYEKENKAALLSVLRHLHGQLETEKPWKISEDYIVSLGGLFSWFKSTNSIYLGHVRVEDFKQASL